MYNKDYRPDLAVLVPELDDDAEDGKSAPTQQPPAPPVAPVVKAAPVVDSAAYAARVVEHVVQGIGGADVTAEARAAIVADVASMLLSLKNAAYAAGFADSRIACRAAVTKEWA